MKTLTQNSTSCTHTLSRSAIAQSKPPDFKTEAKIHSALRDEDNNYVFTSRLKGSVLELISPELDPFLRAITDLETVKKGLILEYRALQMLLLRTPFDVDHFSKISNETAEKIFNYVVQSIPEISTSFKELQELGFCRKLSAHMYNKNVGAFIIDLPKKPWKLPSKRYIFVPEFGLLFTKGAMPTLKEILHWFCIEGGYPERMRPIVDGSLYASQWKAPRRAVLFGGEFSLAVVLEVLAPWLDPILAVTRISAPFLRRLLRIPFNFLLKRIPIFRARHTLGDSQKEYVNMESPALPQEHALDKFSAAAERLEKQKWIHADKDEIKKALELIHQLRVLGVPHTKITGMIPWSRYSKRQGTYPKFEKKIAALREAQGLTDDEVFNEYCRISLELLEIRETIERTRVMLMSRRAILFDQNLKQTRTLRG